MQEKMASYFGKHKEFIPWKDDKWLAIQLHDDHVSLCLLKPGIFPGMLCQALSRFLLLKFWALSGKKIPLRYSACVQATKQNNDALANILCGCNKSGSFGMRRKLRAQNISYTAMFYQNLIFMVYMVICIQMIKMGCYFM